MDNLTYKYNHIGNNPNNGLLDNQLQYVIEGDTDVPLQEEAGYLGDIQGQSPNNYVYDEIGNLIEDASEGITQIYWNIQGKVDAVEYNPDLGRDNISFTYDAIGNRLTKEIDNEAKTKSIYVRDPSWNILAVYKSEVKGFM